MIDPATNRPEVAPDLPAASDVADAAPDQPEIEPRRSTAEPGGSSFAHASEAEMARILDFYGVAWRYEPVTFPILWNLDGEVIESFSPDFYLPDFDLYLEMTTLKQSLVRKKNRKLRRLRELYPDIRIKLFYARDFRAMMLKYGRLGLVESLTGTSGQLARDPNAVAAIAVPASATSGAKAGAHASFAQPPTTDSEAPASTSPRRRVRRQSTARSASDVEIA